MSASSPENSIASIERAIALGADIVDRGRLDARPRTVTTSSCMTTTIDRTTSGRGYVSDLMLEQIRSSSSRVIEGTNRTVTNERRPHA